MTDLNDETTRLIPAQLPRLPVGMDLVSACVPAWRLDRRLLGRFHAVAGGPGGRLVWYAPEDEGGRGVRLDLAGGRSCSLLRLRFSPNRVLCGINHRPAMPWDAGEVMDGVDDVLRRLLPGSGLPSLWSGEWFVSEAHYCVDLPMSGLERGLLQRGLRAVPFRWRSGPMEYAGRGDVDSPGSDDDVAAGTLYDVGGGRRAGLVHVLYDKEAEVAARCPSLAAEVRGVARDEVRLRGGRMLRRFGLRSLGVAEALAREDRLAAFRLMLDRRGMGADPTDPWHDGLSLYLRGLARPSARAACERALMLASLGAAPPVGSDANRLRGMRRAGVHHWDRDVDGMLRAWARDYLFSPPGPWVVRRRDEPDRDAVEAALRLLLGSGAVAGGADP